VNESSPALPSRREAMLRLLQVALTFGIVGGLAEMSGFPKGALVKLEKIKAELTRQHNYITDGKKFKMVDYWESDAVLAPMVDGQRDLNTDCEEYAIVAMRKAHIDGFHARLVVCLDETGEGHCICEVSSDDGTEAYYFDNRKQRVVTQAGLKGYQFYSVSPWDPQPRETRPWQRVVNSAIQAK
jgi:predicted transglutaminase-like cysteine proteinase